MRAAADPPLSPQAMVQSGLCIGCGVCVAPGPTADPMRFNRHGHLVPITDDAGTEAFAQLCPFSPEAPDEDELAAALFPEADQGHPGIGRFLAGHVGHVAEGDFRARGSSGGMLSWLLEELLSTGQIDAVAHVVACDDPGAEGRFFRYTISRTPDEIRRGAQSRYYPVELSGVLATIRREPGRYAVVGLPCFLKAVQLLRRQDPILRDRIVHTLGLFCGHLKSARFVASVAGQVGVSLDQIARVDFRRKASGRPASTYVFGLTLADGRTIEQPWEGLADGDWGAGFFMNPACGVCDDVVAETADASCGDAWVPPYASDPRGTNVLLTRSPSLESLVRQGIAAGRLSLTPVDGAFVARTQAAGLRQRREGLAYRLTWRRRGVRPRKRVAPGTAGLTTRRRLVYRVRAAITWGSPRVFEASRRLRSPVLYRGWARCALAVYRTLVYAGVRPAAPPANPAPTRHELPPRA